ncbi:hypothetical protein CYMTET_12767 [Cymbomonas tetramitiformis]|uniref:Uncharacterized protein n=1 Tax=Cymbomonas tetramitiformis TaxID=36881 RepID=A0AAE0GJX7_9CHLO|nr:hypothetical protein CYMTET_12767 [Cymbomonas tetramitiformis]
MADWACLRKQLGTWAEEFGKQAVADLEGGGERETASKLQEALANSQCDAEDEATRAAAAVAAENAWQKAKEGGGWNTPAWRECYVLACFCQAVAVGSRAAASGDATGLREAMRQVDMASIMGAPAEMVQLMAQEVEKELLGSAEARESAAAAAEPCEAPVRDRLTDIRAGMLQERQVVRLELPSLKTFRKEYFKQDKPVVLTGASPPQARGPHRRIPAASPRSSQAHPRCKPAVLTGDLAASP